jgi:radical SAM protein with 4Fe4S-binding SPASM domain
MKKIEKEIAYRMEQTSGVTDVFSTLKNLEINITDACNRACEFCPHSEEDYQFRTGRAQLSLFSFIAHQLVEKNYTGSIVLCGYGEPTMYKSLREAISILATTNAKIELITNGELLSKEKVKELFAVGLSVINISVYEEQYVEHARLLVEDLKPDQWLIRNRYLGQIELVNRIEIRNGIIHQKTDPCWLLAYKMLVNYNGDVMLCCNDWTRSNVYGNIYETNLWAIWSNNLQDKRLELLSGQRNGVCANCNIHGTSYGADSVAFYENNLS